MEAKGYVFFDSSSSSVTAFNPKSDTHFQNPDHLKVLGVQALEKAKAFRSHSMGISVEHLQSSESEGSVATADISEENSYCRTSDIQSPNGEKGEDELMDDIFLYDEGVKKKLEVLARMVGVESGQPVEILTQVVRVLKDLEEKRRKC
ncbi:uncharacterized protein LOC143845782 [Tasmannia lanceolata]|uniref:uncharacterized protein LOC143845782 n=1 Tax=Tasmannia lanceolata TaxID=3420 RepID=UPI0040645251